MSKTHITIGFKSRHQVPWLMVIKEYIENEDVVFAKVLFEIWPKYFKDKWLAKAKNK